MEVWVDEAGDHRPPGQVDDLRSSAPQLARLRRRADRDDLVALDRDGLSDAAPLVHRQDLAIRQQQVGSQLVRDCHQSSPRLIAGWAVRHSLAEFSVMGRSETPSPLEGEGAGGGEGLRPAWYDDAPCRRASRVDSQPGAEV